LTEPLNGGEDFVCGFDPFVGFGVFIVSGDEGGDIRFEFRGRSVDAALQLF
jgi:hypothetical protein